MLGIVYMAIVFLFGCVLVRKLVNIDSIYETISEGLFAKVVPESLLLIPMGMTFGTAVATFFNYFVIYGLYLMSHNLPKSYSAGIVITVLVMMIGIVFMMKKRIKVPEKSEALVPIKPKFSIQLLKETVLSSFKKLSNFYVVTGIILCVFVSFIMFFSLNMKNDELRVGLGVAGDVAVHIATTSSFGVGGNIPTEHVLFPGEGMRWHFFFYFFCGILEYLGLRIDLAINIPSIVFMVVALSLAGLLAELISKNKWAYAVTPLLILFRSSLNGFYEIITYHKNGAPILKSILHNGNWSSMMPYDDWGIYTINVPTNQRHFMYGASVILLLVFLFLPYLKEALESVRSLKVKETFKKLFFSKEAWKMDFNDNRLFLAIILVATMPYFHGSALITGLLILFGFAIFSRYRLSYLMVAYFAVASSLLQTKFFSGGVGNVFKPSLKIGFVLQDLSMGGFFKYIIATTGIMSFILLVNLFLQKGKLKFYLCTLFSFILPYIFAFLVQTSYGIHDNHKYILYSFIFLDIWIVYFLTRVGSGKKFIGLRRVAFVIILFVLTYTGISEFCTFINKNKNYMYLNNHSEMEMWVKNNTEESDVFLTPTWWINSFFLTGRKIYFGWPMIALVLDYDADTRDAIYQNLLKGYDGNKAQFVATCKENNIKYIVDMNEMFDYKSSMGYSIYNQKFVENNFKQVASFGDDTIRIFQIYD